MEKQCIIMYIIYPFNLSKKENISKDKKSNKEKKCVGREVIINCIICHLSNLGLYILHPQDKFSWVPNCSLGPLNVKRSCPKKLVWAMLKCMVSMATHSGFENGGMPTKVLISQLLLIIDY